MSHVQTAVLSDFLAGMFEGASDGLCLVAPDDTVLRANQKWLGSAGLSAEQAVGADIVELFPETRELARGRYARARAGERVAVPRHRQVILGQESWWDGIISPVRMDGGTGLLITARELAPSSPGAGQGSGAAASPPQVEAIASLVDAMQEGVVAVDLDFKVTHWSRGAERLLGWTAEELLGRCLFDFTRPDPSAPGLDVFRQRVLEGQLLKETGPRRRKDGSIVVLESFYSVLRAPGGAPTGVLGVARDVTEAVAAEDALRLARDKDLARRINEIELVVRMDGRLLEVNDRAVEAYGYTREELLALRITDLRTDPAGDVSAQMSVALARGIRFEALHRRKDGSTFPVEVSSRSFEVDGELLLHSLVRDLTEQRRAEEALLTKERRLAAALAELDAVLADSPMAFAKVKDRTGVWCNQRMTELLGWTHEELRGQPTSRLFGDADSWREFGEKTAATLDAAGTCTFEHPFRHRDGREVWVRAHGRQTGEPGELVWLFEDVTALRQAERAGRGRQDLLDCYFRTPAIGIAFAQPGAGILEANPTLCSMLGYAPDELRGMDWRRFTHPDDHPQEEAALGRLLRGEAEVARLEKRYLRKDGSSFWATASFSAARDASTGALQVIGLVADIDGRKRAELALAESEARFRAVANTAPVLIWVSGLDMGCTWFNAPWLEFTGRTQEQEHGNGWAEGVHPDDLDRCLRTYVTAFDRREPFRMDYRLRRHDGAWRWLTDHGVPRYGPGGEFQGYVGSCVDVTDLREATERAEALAREQELLLQTGAVGISKLVDRRQVWVNQRFAEIFGYAREELLGQTTRGLYPSAEAYQALGREAYPALAKGGAFVSEQELVRKDGTRIQVRHNGMAIDPGDLSRGTIWFTEDVSQARAAQRRLAEAEARVRGYFESPAIGVAVAENGGRLVDVNPAFCGLVGYSREELLGRGWQDVTVPEDVDLGDEGRRRMLAGETQTCTFEKRFRRRDGTPVWTLVTLCLVEPGPSGARRIAAMIQDATAQVQAREALRESERRLASVIEGSNDGYWEWHVPSGRVVFSHRLASMLGYAPGDLAPDLASWLKLVHPDDLPAIQAALRPHLEGKAERYQCEHRLRRKDGSWAWVLQRGQVAERAADGAPLRAAGTHTDVTQRREAVEALRAANAANERLIGELKDALDHVKSLRGLLPICMHCHKIRNDQGYWDRIEEYVAERTEAVFSHGLCPDCFRRHYPED